MKKLIPFACALALAATPAAMGQNEAVSNPVGYVTQSIAGGGTFTFIGLTLHGSTVARPVVASTSGDNIVVDAGGIAALTGGPYILEVTSGATGVNGAAAKISSVNIATNTITLEAGSGVAGSLAADDTLLIREAPTLGSIFGTGADVIINKGDINTGDRIFVPSGGGNFDIYFHTEDSVFGSGAWTSAAGGSNIENTPLLYTDGLFVQNRGVDAYNLIVPGEVKLTSTVIGTADDFTYLGNPYPVGTTLDGSNLANSTGFQKGDQNTGDLVYIADSMNPGNFRIFFHTEDSVFGSGAWTESGGVGDGTTELSSGIIIFRRAATAYNATVDVPASYPAP